MTGIEPVNLILTKDALYQLSYMGMSKHTPKNNYGAGDGARTRHPQLGRLTLYQMSYSRMVVGEGVEPSKALPTDLQSVPFDHSGTPPLYGAGEGS